MDDYFWSIALSTTGVLFLVAAAAVTAWGLLIRGEAEMVPRYISLAGGLLFVACLDFIASLVVLVVMGP